MIDFFNRWYSLIQNTNPLLTKCKIYSLYRFFVRIMANILLPVYFFLTKKNKRYSLNIDGENNKEFIVSLTSFPARINRLWLVIETMLRQSVKPDRIILWLSKEQFPTISSVPKSLLEMQKRGLQIEFREDDLRSHKKYCYSFNEYPESVIITIDDDIFYPTTIIENLIIGHKENPQAVHCSYTRSITWDEQGNLLPYTEWVSQRTNLFFGSGGGTLFPPHKLYKDVTAMELAVKLCPLADDIWLNSMCRLNDVKIFEVRRKINLLPVINENSMDLSERNLSDGMNDIQLQQIRKYYMNEIGIDPFMINT